MNAYDEMLSQFGWWSYEDENWGPLGEAGHVQVIFPSLFFPIERQRDWANMRRQITRNRTVLVRYWMEVNGYYITQDFPLIYAPMAKQLYN